MKKIINGTSVFKSIVIGEIFVYAKKTDHIKEPDRQSTEIELEIFENAKTVADKQLEELYTKALAEVGEEEAMILDVQRLMIQDIDLNTRIDELIKNDNLSSYKAIKQAGEEFSNIFASMDDEYMKARAVDVLDLTKRLGAVVIGEDLTIELHNPSIILAQDLTPSETLQLDRNKILGFVTQEGSSNSHTAILAGVLNIPTLIQTPVTLDDSLNGTTGIVDGVNGKLILSPDKETLSEYKKLIEEQLKGAEKLKKLIGTDDETIDGKKINLFANIGSPDDIPAVLNNDAKGIGLFRSEFLYLQRNDYPSEEEQFKEYKKVVEGMEGKKVIIRTLDIGADKQADYFNLDKEENPALGFRAIRICLERPDLFKTQLRAIYRASAFGNVSIMFPMIISVWEVVEAKKIANEVIDELKNEGVSIGEVEIGVMIETPASVIIADELAKEVDFFSVGTNDLTQYTLAIDRQNSKIDRFHDPHHPAVMKMLAMIAKSAVDNGIWAGICGELAADVRVAKEFLKMGYTELSVSPAYVLPLREIIQNTDTTK